MEDTRKEISKIRIDDKDYQIRDSYLRDALQILLQNAPVPPKVSEEQSR